MKKVLKVSVLLMVLMILFTIKVNADTPLTINKTTLDVVLNGNGYLSAYGGNTSKKLKWSSSNEKVAIVDQYGNVKGIGIGQATITCTKGSENVTCKVNVIYGSINIKGNDDFLHDRESSPNTFYLGIHESETLKAIIKDYNNQVISNASVTWKSSDSSIAKVDNGKVTVLKVGSAKITAEAAGVSDDFFIKVFSKPNDIDLNSAKFEMLYNDNYPQLKISNVNPNDTSKVDYNYIITSNNNAPELKLNKYGGINSEYYDNLRVNAEENYMYTYDLSKYVELNQDLYLWIAQTDRLESGYTDENGNSISSYTRFILKAKKLERASLPQLNLILQSFWISSSSYTDKDGKKHDGYTSIWFNYPTANENRKFTLKIGKVTDYNILNKIKANNYDGIKELLEYAKKNNSIYNKELTTVSQRHYSQEKQLFDGKKLLENKSYYYIYAKLDDENGKYFPVEGITLGEAFVSQYSDSWDIWAYTSDKFTWENLSSTYTPTSSNEVNSDPTISQGRLPQTGSNVFYVVNGMLILGVVSLVILKKINQNKDIK